MGQISVEKSCSPGSHLSGNQHAARALRSAGWIEASWAAEITMPGQIGRRSPQIWLRINPVSIDLTDAPPYSAIYTRAPKLEAKAALTAAEQLYATSPGIAAALRRLLPPSRSVTLWRPALSRPLWADFTPVTGINSRPRILWIDEGLAPDWLAALINETMHQVLWIVVERTGTSYAGTVTCIRPPGSEQGWATELATLAPHLCIRPLEREGDAGADHYPSLLAAAAGCKLLIDERLDCPPSLGAIRLPNRLPAWQRALAQSIETLQETMAIGQAARAACLALPAIEDEPPPWARLSASALAGQQAAE